MRHHRPFLAALALLTLLLTTLAAPSLATILVTTTADEAGENLDACSLREAVQSINDVAGFGGCVLTPGETIIVLQAGTYQLVVNERIVLSQPMTILGQGPSLTTIEPGEAFDDDLFLVLHDSPGGKSTVEGLTLRGLTGRNPAIRYISSADLDLRNLVIRDNATTRASIIRQVENGPGALSLERVVIDNNRIFDNSEGAVRCGRAVEPREEVGGRASLHLVDVLLRDNLVRNTSGDASGGALHSDGCDLFLTNVTFDSNEARSDSGNAFGGAMALSTIDADLNTVELTNVTFFGNSAGIGGAFYQETDQGVSQEVTLTNVTFAENTAAVAGDHLFQEGGNTGLRNVLFGPTSGSNCGGSPAPVVTLLGGNIDADASCGVERTVLEPGLDVALSQPSGLTPTLGLAPGSPAIDTGTDDGCPESDQRGALRPFDGDEDGNANCDVGAFEVAVEIFSDGFESGDLSAWLDPIG